MAAANIKEGLGGRPDGIERYLGWVGRQAGGSFNFNWCVMDFLEIRVLL